MACGHAAYRPLSVSVLALVDPVGIARDAIESQKLLDSM